MTDVINQPPLNSALPVTDEVQQFALWTPPWANWFAKAQLILFATSQSGTTALRPTKNLYIGQVYFDVSLGAKGKPIFLGKDLATWVDASGAAV